MLVLLLHVYVIAMVAGIYFPLLVHIAVALYVIWAQGHYSIIYEYWKLGFSC